MSSTKEWLQQIIDPYQAHKTDTCEAIEDHVKSLRILMICAS
jgi:hypothetical protein